MARHRYKVNKVVGVDMVFYNNFKKDVITVIVMILSAVFSTYLHSPDTPVIYNYGLKYNDILYGVFYQILRLDNWFDSKFYLGFIYRELMCPIPYVHYHFEYPPFIGLTWYVSTCVGFKIASKANWIPGHYIFYFDVAGKWHFYIQALIIAVFALITVITLIKLGEIYRAKFNPALFALLPSTIVYLVYNWDIIATAFALLSIYMVEKKRLFTAGVLIGLSISTKILPIGIALWFFIEKTFIKREIVSMCKYVCGAVLTGLLPFLAIWFISPRGFTSMILHHATWYCENCIYLLIIRDIASNIHRILYPVLISLFTLYIIYIVMKKQYEESLRPVYLFLFQTGFVLFNYVFTPQMLLLITPLALIIIKNYTMLLTYLLADILNAILIIIFFNELSIGVGPWFFGSQTQWISTARNMIMLSIILCFLFKIRGYSLFFKASYVTRDLSSQSI